MKYADFHIHPSFKAYLSKLDPAQKSNCWTSIRLWISRFWRPQNRILDSQACFKQIQSGDLNLIVVPLYALEKAFAENFLLGLVAFFSKKVDIAIFKAIKNNSLSYYKQFGQSFDHLKKAQTDGVLPPGLCFLDNNSFSENKINIALSVEGAHCFIENEMEISNPLGFQNILDRIAMHKQKDRRLLDMNLTHLTQQPFCNHSFGMKLINHNDFKPVGDGITLAGYQIIDTALQDINGQHRILLDVKHMSLKSRSQYYNYIKEKYVTAYKSGKLPVIASHVGVTGISWNHIDDYIIDIQHSLQNKDECVYVDYRLPQGKIGTLFNPWSINLYDEDIVEILLSGGIIGLSLDQRILGCGDVAKEKMSYAEFKTQVPIQKTQIFDDKEPRQSQDPEIHFLSFCNNLCHIVAISQQIKTPLPRPIWGSVCLASDFDGLIDPMDGCYDASQMKQLESGIRKYLPAMAAAYKILLPDPDKALEQLFYKNVKDFIDRHY